MFFSPQTTSFVHSITAVIFYLIMAGFVIYSLFAVYALMRYGKNKTLTILVAVVYIAINAALYLTAVRYLNEINL